MSNATTTIKNYAFMIEAIDNLFANFEDSDFELSNEDRLLVLDYIQLSINETRQQLNTTTLQQDNEPTIKELFEQADEIMDKPVYDEYEVVECDNGQVINQTTYGEVKRTSLKRETNVKKAAAKRSKSVDTIVEKVAAPKPNAYRDAKSQQTIDETKKAALAIKPEKVSNYSTKQRVKSAAAPKAEKANAKTHDGRTYAELRTFISTMTKANADCKKIAQGIAKRHGQKSWATAGWQGYQEIYDAIKSYQ